MVAVRASERSAFAVLYFLCVSVSAVSGFALVNPPASDAALADPAEALFERLEGLEGVWEGSSTQGWDGRVEYRLIGRGSALMGLSSYEAHPDDTMATIYYRDGDEVGLTHYCVSGNQPRLVATEIAPDGRRATFTFAGATGLSSRDEGHMDKVVVEFVDDDEFVSRWSWYEDGEERWLEEIRYRRVR